MKENMKFSKLVFVVFLALVFGGIIGKVIEALPDSTFRRAALNTIAPFEMSIGMGHAVRNQDGTVAEYIEKDPVVIDLGFFVLKFGVAWRFNFAAFLGALLAFYLFRIYRH